MKMFRANSSQRGFTLIELMIAMLIGVFLMMGVIQIFISAKQAYRLQENLSRLQENGRFAMDIMTKDIRMAGYVNSACIPVTTLPVVFDQANTTNNWCSSSNRNCVTSTTANTVNNIRTDVIRTYQWPNLALATPPTAASCPPTAPPAVLPATTTNQSEISYFIRGDDSNNNIPSLWSYDGTTTQERVEGIERMQVLYGIDRGTVPVGGGIPDITKPDYIPDYYADASQIQIPALPQVSDWTKIVSIRITLLAVTLDNGLTIAPQPYTYNGVTTTPPDVCASNGVIVSALPCVSPNVQVKDLRIRRVFSTTIAVRNRLP